MQRNDRCGGEKPERGKFLPWERSATEMSMKRLFTRGGSRYARSAFIHGITSVCDSPRKLERSRRYLFILLPPDRRLSLVYWPTEIFDFA